MNLVVDIVVCDLISHLLSIKNIRSLVKVFI